jgi:Kef-type K+ transport system membrane component KefB
VSLTASDLLVFLVSFPLLLGVARGLGEVARRINQPQVIGELLAGVVLGPSLLGALLPHTFQRLFPSGGVPALLLQLVSELGVILLLLLSGIDVDLALVRRKARPALLVAAGGVLVPFLCGYGLAALLPQVLVAEPQQRPLFLLFVATAMSISAIPVIVKILLDMDLMRRDAGQITLAAGVINDTTGWFLLAVVSGIATARALPLDRLTLSVFGTLAYAAFCFTIGYRLIRGLVHWVDDQFASDSATLSAVLFVGLGGAAITQALHVEPFLGAFLVGIQLARIPRVTRAAQQQLEAMTLGVFAPIFFATAGLRVDIPALLRPSLLLALVAVIAVACVGKFVGTYAGARLAGLSPWMSAALGSGMNARGAVEIVVASVGLTMGILTVPMYSIIVTMAVVTSVIAPPLLRWTLRRAPVDPEEERRLRREAREARSFLHGLRRMLVPVRDGRYALVAAEVVGRIAGARAVEAVALHVQVQGSAPPPPMRGPDAREGADGSKVEWSQRSVPATAGVAAAILAEAARDYDLLVLGATEARPEAGLFGTVVDAVVRQTPCTTLVLRAPTWRQDGVRIRRILLPTAGTQADLRAAEFGLALAGASQAEAIALHVVQAAALAEPLGGRAVGLVGDAVERGWQATVAVSRLAAESGVPLRREVRTRLEGGEGQEIVQYAARTGCDLIVLHAERRLTTDELYCGRTVEQVLRTAACPVAVLLEAAV